jgi:predicted HTH transcriptional regulator
MVKKAANSQQTDRQVVKVGWDERDPQLVARFLELLVKNGVISGREIADERDHLKILGRMGLLSADQDRTTPCFTVAGVLLLCRRRLPDLFPQVKLTDKRPEGKVPSGDYTLPLLELRENLLGALAPLCKRERRSSPDRRNVEDGGERVLYQYQYPPQALEEAVTNLLLHRDYFRGEPRAEIVIRANDIEFVNPAGDNPTLRQAFTQGCSVVLV